MLFWRSGIIAQILRLFYIYLFIFLLRGDEKARLLHKLHSSMSSLKKNYETGKKSFGHREKKTGKSGNEALILFKFCQISVLV